MADFLPLLYNWYNLNKRDLPWRNTSDPYKIWVSEIILQQTRVSQGLSYYLNFIRLFPTVKALANAPEEKVLKAWQGLGYYSRARNLLLSSRIISKKYYNIFPEQYENILALKGIGEYTAAAIASIAFNKPYAAVDGNISRVIARLYEVNEPINSSNGSKIIKTIATELLNRNEPGKHNQALMELGATVCKPSSPKCMDCPISGSCLAFSHKTYSTIPFKNNTVKQKIRYFYYFLFEENDHIYLHKRTENDIWKNLYQLPLIESDKELTVEEMIYEATIRFALVNNNNEISSVSKNIIHILSHQKIHARFIHIKKTDCFKLPSPLIRVNKKDIPNFVVPRLIEKFLENINTIK